MTQGTGPTAQTTIYAYDDVGNRTSRTTGSRSTVYAHDAARQLTSAARKVAGVTVETVNLAHDGAGRLTSLTGTAGSRTLGYDARGVLSSVATTTGAGLASLTTTTNRTTDGDGTVVSAVTTAPGGTTTTGFTWDPSLAIPEVATTSTGGADVDHLYGMGRALALRGGQSDTCAVDVHGSTLAIGEAADLARAAGYDEFGVPQSSGTASLFDEVAGLTASGGDAEPLFGYRGETHLDGLVHLRARDYSPGLGRFTTVDPLDGLAGETTVANPYPYAANDPLNMVDPLGLSPLSDLDLRNPLTGLTGGEFRRFQDCLVDAYTGSSWSSGCASLRSTVLTRRELLSIEGLYTEAMFTEFLAAQGKPIFPAGYDRWSDVERLQWLKSQNLFTTDQLAAATIAWSVGTKLSGKGKPAQQLVTPTPQVSNPKLQNIVNDLYKGTTNPGRVGTGTTADALRFEVSTGQEVFGKSHLQKAEDYLRGLENWLKATPDGSYFDRLVARSLADDLLDALGRPR